MKVKELIRKLNKFDPEWEVIIDESLDPYNIEDVYEDDGFGWVVLQPGSSPLEDDNGE